VALIPQASAQATGANAGTATTPPPAPSVTPAAPTPTTGPSAEPAASPEPSLAASGLRVAGSAVSGSPSTSPAGTPAPAATPTAARRAAEAAAGTRPARAPATLRTFPEVALSITGTRSAGVPTAVAGTVVAYAPGPVTILVQARSGSTWRTVVATAATDGVFATTWTPVVAGTLTLRAVAVQTGQETLVSRSSVVRVVGDGAAITVSAVSGADIGYSYRPGCPVSPASLRALAINYWDFRGVVHRGTLVAASWAVSAYEKLFQAMFAARFPIRQMRPVEYYYFGVASASASSDVASMTADNTSAFNCRKVTGNPYRMSRHSWGDAIDLNPQENPYLIPGRVYPTDGKYFLNRHRYQEGMILPGSIVAVTMSRLHWYWGARWSNPDYQHFSANGQ
jgi:hypothetical protein